jgi:hypothetical protein
MIGRRMDDLTNRAATLADEPVLLSVAARTTNFDVPPWPTPGEITDRDAAAMMASIRAGEQPLKAGSRIRAQRLTRKRQVTINAAL